MDPFIELMDGGILIIKLSQVPSDRAGGIFIKEEKDATQLC